MDKCFRNHICPCGKYFCLVLLYRPNSQPFRFWNGKFPFRNLRSDIMVLSWDAHFGNHLGTSSPTRHWIFWIINDHILLIHNIVTISLSHYIDINNYFNYITYIYLFIYNANLLGTGLSMLGFKMGSFPFRNGKLPILKLPIFKTSHTKKVYVCV